MGRIRAIVVVVSNAILWPGLGTMIGGRCALGFGQGCLFLLIWALMTAAKLAAIVTERPVFDATGVALIPFLAAVWMWGVITAVELLRGGAAPPKPSKRRRPSRTLIGEEAVLVN